MPAEPILELGSTMLNPAIDRGVIDAHAPRPTPQAFPQGLDS